MAKSDAKLGIGSFSGNVLEDVQLAYLRTDVQVHAHDVEVAQRADILHAGENLLVGDAELAVGLARVDAVVGLRVDVGVDAQGDVDDLARLACERIDYMELLRRLAVDGHDALFDGVAQLLVALAHARIDNALRVEAGLDGAAYLVARRAVDSESVFADYLQKARIEVGLDGVVNPVTVIACDRGDVLERPAQQLHIVEIEWSLICAEFCGNLSA